MQIIPRNFTLTNYHTHTFRCMHATGIEEEYILRAIETGFQTLGFSDHTPWPYRSDFVANMRMPISQLDDYIETLCTLRERYSDRISIRIGLECEAFPEYFDWLAKLKATGKVEFLILGNHYDTTDEYHTIPYFGHVVDPELINRYTQTTIAGMRSGLFSYLCHPDLFLQDYPVFDQAAREAVHMICSEAEKLDMPLEYNLLGLQRQNRARAIGGLGYTTNEFWSIASKYRIRAIIGIDAHAASSLDCLGEYIGVREHMARLNIPVIEQLPI